MIIIRGDGWSCCVGRLKWMDQIYFVWVVEVINRSDFNGFQSELKLNQYKFYHLI